MIDLVTENVQGIKIQKCNWNSGIRCYSIRYCRKNVNENVHSILVLIVNERIV